MPFEFDFSRLLPFFIKLWFSLLFVGFLILVAKIVASRVKHNVSNDSIESNAYNERLGELMWDVTYWAIITFAIMIFFEMMGINIGFLIAWLTFGIWFAIKEILGNMFAGLMILTNKKFTIGDIVQFEWWLNYFGKITEINIRHTIVQTFDHRKVIVPNIVLVSNFVKTFSTEAVIKSDVSIGLWFQNDPKIVCEWIKAYLMEKDFIVEKEAIRVMVTGVFHSGYDIKAYFYLKPRWKQWLLVAKSIIKKELLQLYDKNNWEYPWDHVSLTTDVWDGSLVDVWKKMLRIS